MLGTGTRAVRHLLFLCLVVLIACETRPTATGRANAWIKGESVYARIGSVGTLLQAPKVELKNDSSRPVTILPLTLTVVYKTAGRRQMIFHADSGIPEKLEPGKDLTLDHEISVSELTAGESPEQIRVDIGPPKGGERFVADF
jgi:hypothetical protein